MACWVISCLRGLLVVVTRSSLGPKITAVPAGDGDAELVGALMQLASLPSSEDAERMELIQAQR